MNDYKSDLIKLLTSKNPRAKVIGILATIPTSVSLILPIALNEKLDLKEKIIILSSGASSILITVGVAALDPNQLIDEKSKKDET